MNKTKLTAIGTMVLVLAGAGLVRGQGFEFALNAGLARTSEYGKTADYSAGVNDFPVTPAHQGTSFGGSFTLFFMKFLGIRAGGRYTMGANVTLTDPSDADTVSIKTSPHAALTADLVAEFPIGAVRPYILAGGGFDILLGGAQTATSSYGYPVELAKPSKTTRTMAEAGGGIKVLFGARFGLMAEARYVMIFDANDTIKTLHFDGGFLIRF